MTKKKNYDYSALRQLVNIDSPSGFTEKASEFVFNYLSDLGYKPKYSAKGAVSCQLSDKPSLLIAAHVDTLGAIVSGINADGSLSFSLVGSLSLNDAEGAYVRIHTLDDRVYTGTLLLKNPAKHANKDLGTIVREAERMFVRLDEEVFSKSDTLALGIQIGDFICLEPHYQELPSGYIKSRFMDNKAGCFVLFEIARHYAKAKKRPAVELYFSNYEEVGHGGTSGYSSSIEEMLVIDMGVVGDACEGGETFCSICAKDTSGPYDFGFRKRLVALCQEHKIAYKQDVYPYYGSDGSAALRAGKDVRVGLIGPGVSASHGSERTHKKGVEATIELCIKYIDTHCK